MHVIFIHGPAASGKHTIGSLLAQRLGIPLFHNHLTVDLALNLFDFGSESFIRLRSTVWLASFGEAAVAGKSFVFTFHPEATVEKDLIARLVTIVESAGGRIHFIELKCSRDAVLQRLTSESRAKFRKLMDREFYGRLEQAGAFEYPPLPTPILVVDTEQVLPPEAAALIERALAAGT